MQHKFAQRKPMCRHVLIAHLIRQGFFYPPLRLWVQYAADDLILRECLHGKN